jgi:hypothetical protein
MSRRLRLTFVVVACAGITAGAAAAQTGGAYPSVKPKTGTPSTRFMVSFRAPQTAGQRTFSRLYYGVSADNGSRSRGCSASTSSSVSQAAAGAMIHVKLSPTSPGRRWCRGVFHGQIQEFVLPVCGCPGPVAASIVCPLADATDARLLCPALVPAPQTIGTFSFRVRKHG